MRTDPYIKEVSSLGIMARCKDDYDPWRCCFHPELSPGESYPVTHIRMTSDFTYLKLEGKDGCYNSVCFDFLIGGNEHDIYNDIRCWSEPLIRRMQLFEKETE